MKKFFCLCMVAFIIASMPVVVNAVVVEKEQYTIDLPGHFAEIEESKFVGENSQSFSVTVEENTKDTICVAEMSQKDVEKYVNEMAETSKKAFESLGRQGAMEVLSAEVQEHNSGKKALAVAYKTTAEGDGKTTVLYQKTYEFSCVNNKYLFVFTANTEKELADFQTSFDSITINEAEDKGFVGDIGAYITVAIIFGLFILGIVRFIRTPAKRNKK